MEALKTFFTKVVTFCDTSNYLYRCDKVETNGDRYLRCLFENEFKCCSRVILRSDSSIKKTASHNHRASLKETNKYRFKNALINAIVANPRDELFSVYVNTVQQFSKFGYKMPSFSSIKQTMVRARNNLIPPIPRDFDHFDSLILSNEYMVDYTHDSNHNVFYRGIFHDSLQQSQIIVFSSQRVYDHIQSEDSLFIFIDGTFKCVPKDKLLLQQLIVVKVNFLGKSFPLVYALDQRKTVAVYETVLTYLKNLVGSSRVCEIMCDYEDAIRAAVRNVFPHATLRGCWFHFSKAILKKAKALGVCSNLFESSIDTSLLRMVMSLPLLPKEDIISAVTSLEQLIPCHEQEWDTLFVYLNHYWLPLNISVFDTDIHTNNAMESFNRTLMRLIKKRHPSIWTLLHHITSIDSVATNNMDILISGGKISRPPNRIYTDFQKRLTVAYDRYKKRKIGIDFLREINDLEVDLIVDESFIQYPNVHTISVDEDDYSENSEEFETVESDFEVTKIANTISVNGMS